MQSDAVISTIGFFVIAYFLWWSIKSWVKDLVFYYQTSWDFSKDSGVALYYGMGGIRTSLVPNRKRVVFALPLLILICLVIWIVVGYRLYELSLGYSDIPKL